jgi:flagellar protein FlbD
MIQLTRINHSSLILNSDLIEHLQATPDTLVTLSNGHTYLVLDTPDEVVRKITAFRRQCLGCAALTPRQDFAHV